MSAQTIKYSRDALLLDGADDPDGDQRTVSADPASDPAAEQVPPKVRTKRPRPTFDDGSITRIFKFPSKTYPRSTYYVTGAEIIIRIKKARKKWKLVVPKKRTVSYRTNRWFAKPRWVEIELTYTQASKLGLVEQRPLEETTEKTSAVGQAGDQAIECVVTADEPEITADGETILEPMAAEPPPQACPEAPAAVVYEADAIDLTDDSSTDIATTDAQPEATLPEVAIHAPAPEVFVAECWESLAAPSSSVAADGHAICEIDRQSCLAIDPDVETPEPPGCFDSSDSALNPELAVPSHIIALPDPPPATSVEEQAPPLPHQVGSDHPGDCSKSGVSIKPSATDKPARKVAAALLMTLVVLSAGSAVGRFLLGDASETRIDHEAACTRLGPVPDCTPAPITGSIAKVDESDAPGRAALTAQPHAIAEPAAATAQEELGATEVPSTAIQASGVPQETPPVSAIVDHENERAAADSAAIVTRDLPVEALTVSSLDLSQVAAAVAEPPCHTLIAAAQSIDIQFGYTSSSVDPATVALLSDIAGKLRSCPAATLIIEGHTDSDGDADRNWALSV